MLAPTRARSTKSKSRLLYLGNDLKLIAAVRQQLTEPEYRRVACSDRDGVILFLKSDIPYDVLLIDLEWRDREGLELARLARSLRHRKRMPIILAAVTALSNELEGQARKVGVKRWVRKTPDMAALCEAIRDIVKD
jgi:DNA-binding response OmpR family regulator